MRDEPGGIDKVRIVYCDEENISGLESSGVEKAGRTFPEKMRELL
jgi:hypothetical protein